MENKDPPPGTPRTNGTGIKNPRPTLASNKGGGKLKQLNFPQRYALLSFLASKQAIFPILCRTNPRAV